MNSTTGVPKACAILLHGLGRTAISMSWIAADLRARGYAVVNQGYPSRRKPVAELAKAVGRAIEKCAQQGAGRIDFVTHSMGGILLRHYFSENALIFPGRAVLLGPPNSGSEIVDQWGKRWWYQLANGPAGGELGTDAHASPQTLPTLPMVFGVIAGDARTQNVLLPKMPLPHDGKVSVFSTHLAGEADHITLPVSHTWLTSHPLAREHAVRFLETGKFRKQ